MPDRTHPPSYLDCATIDAFLRRALQADIGTGDATTIATVAAGTQVHAAFVSRECTIAAGLHLAARTFGLLDPDTVTSWACSDGDQVRAGETLGTLRGSARAVLQGERLALNIMQRMSGIASATRRLVKACHPVRVRDTRKTAPGLNLLDKWAVLLGGGVNHRLGLYDRMLVKDNHISAAGGIAPAIRLAHAYRSRHAPNMCIEVEVRTHTELEEALRTGGFDEILLDNMVTVSAAGIVDARRLEAAVALIGGRYVTEASGNITLRTAGAIAATGVDYISCGALTHSVQAADIALKVLRNHDHEH